MPETGSGSAALLARERPRLSGDCLVPDHCSITPVCFDVPGSGQRVSHSQTSLIAVTPKRGSAHCDLSARGGEGGRLGIYSETGGLPPCSAMDENRYFAMREHLDRLPGEHERRDAV